jgi:hypothetical protein
VAIAVTAIFAQTAVPPAKTGSIQGTVVGSDGTALPGAHVYAALKAAVTNVKGPPTLVTTVANGTTASSANSFTISNLPMGSYILCAQTTTPGWLDPCHWSASVPTINLAAGQNLTGQTVVMTKGAVVQIRINDPSKLLTAAAGAIVHDVEVVALGSNNAYYNARITSTDTGGRNEQVTLPFNLTHTLIIRSQQFALTDSTGAPVPASGHSQPLQIAPTAVAPQFTYTVAGQAH